MKRNFTLLFAAFLCFFITNCRTANAPAESNDNQAAADSTAAANADSNVAAAKTPETVPAFTNADEAAVAGDKYLDAIETENAIDAFRQAVKLNPDFGDAYFKLGIAYALREKEEKAGATIGDESAAAAAATPAKTKKNKKDVEAPLTESGKAFDNAAKIYEKILKKNPKDDAALYNLGRAYNKLNKDTESEKALRQAVKLQPENVDYLIEFGSILMKLAKYDEAVTVLTKAVKIDDSNIQAQDLLEKADAGKKRINFGIEPKPLQPTTTNTKPTKPSASPSTPTATPSAAPSAPKPPTPKPAPTK